MAQTITPELRQWIVEQVQAGCSPESVLQSMRDAGWQESVALLALETTLTQHLKQQGVNVDAVLAAQSLDEVQVAVAQASAQAQTATATATATADTRPNDAGRHTVRAHKRVPEPDLTGSPRQIDLGDRVVEVLLSVARPRVVLFGNFLSPEECDGLIALAQPRMARSLTVENATGGEAVNADRTSNGMFFRRGETELISRIEARIARLTHWPVENGEGVQVLNYKVGAEYKPHYDYFDPAAPGTPTILKRGGQRVGTLVMYLNNPEQGGGTTFPDAGLEVCPQKGHAVFFSYERAHPSSQTLHGGAPVLAGEKWVATKWMREREFA
jgi:prolyl 4-hydroxylase